MWILLQRATKQGILLLQCRNRSVEEINVPEGRIPRLCPIAMGAGIDHILVAYSDIDYIGSASFYSVAQVQMYNLKTQTFNKLLECDGCVVDNGKKQVTCYTFDTNRYGDGTRIDEVYDYDGEAVE